MPFVPFSLASNLNPNMVETRNHQNSYPLSSPS
ncbi:hypothetical protein NC652_014997 [Populus alba x Populus x berolinensis]|nr:hypothetical protein NC652_014997 [Populus alba x Populus x berolinensis]